MLAVDKDHVVPLTIPIPKRRSPKVVDGEEATDVMTMTFCFQNSVVILPVRVQTAKFVYFIQQTLFRPRPWLLLR